MPTTLRAVATALVLLVAAAPAGAVTVTLGPAAFDTINSGPACVGDLGHCTGRTIVQSALGVPGTLAAPSDGTVVSWRVHGVLHGTGAIYLRVVHETPSGYAATATSAAATAVDGSPVATSLEIAAGDTIAVETRSGATTGDSATISGHSDAGSSWLSFEPVLTDGAAPRNGTLQGAPITMLFNADVVLAVPTIDALDPASGPAAGGTSVTITGQHLLGTSAVTFGSTPATITSVTNTQVVAIAPAGSGTVPVTVATPGGASSAAEFSYTPPAPLPRDVTRPVIQKLSLASKRFVAANTGPAVAARVGTPATIQVSEASTLTFTVARRTSGVRKGKSCLARTRRRHGRACTRFVALKGSFTKAVPSGTSSFRIEGRLHGRALARGTYRLSVRATDAAGNVSRVRRATFTIVGR